jgi:hypothetical protein
MLYNIRHMPKLHSHIRTVPYRHCRALGARMVDQDASSRGRPTTENQSFDDALRYRDIIETGELPRLRSPMSAQA